jgi:2-oxoglutarate ferredoxin oxidoreductase subunit gamma
MSTTKILMAGEGGQGVQVTAEILAKAAFKQGLYASYIPNFGVEQRGGVSLAFVVIDSQPIVYPKFQEADLLAIFSDRSISRAKDHYGPKTKIILGPAVTAKEPSGPNVSRLNGQKIPTRSWNMMVMGKINQLGQLVKNESLFKVMDKRFQRYYQKNPKLKETNQKAVANEF